jgi:hypothetical protein
LIRKAERTAKRMKNRPKYRPFFLETNRNTKLKTIPNESKKYGSLGVAVVPPKYGVG